MKKTYIAPVVDLEEMNGDDELLTASPTLSIDNGYIITEDSNMGSKTHSYNLWGDDEE